MSTSFKIFVDADASAPATTSIKTRSTSTAKKSINSIGKGAAPLKSKNKTVAAVHDENDKENIDPLTGLASSSSSTGKKSKKVSGAGLRPKSVRSKTSPAKLGLSLADGNAKHGSGSGAVKKGLPAKRRPFGSISNLAVMLEEAENEVEGARVETAADRRARELTVLPLADISEAFITAVEKKSESQQSASSSSTLIPATQPATQTTLFPSLPSTPVKTNRGTKRICDDEDYISSSGGESPSKRKRTRAPIAPACAIIALSFFASSPAPSPSAIVTAPHSPSSLGLVTCEL